MPMTLTFGAGSSEHDPRKAVLVLGGFGAVLAVALHDDMEPELAHQDGHAPEAADGGEAPFKGLHL